MTGGSRGIGRAIAERLAEEGADVAICARNANEVEAAVESLKRRKVRASGAVVDVADADALKSWIEVTGKALGGIDILVANASGFAASPAPEEFRKAFDVDLMHTVNACEAARPMLESAREGSVIAIASISGVEDYGYPEVAYGALKAALLFYVKSLAGELRPPRHPRQCGEPRPDSLPGRLLARCRAEATEALCGHRAEVTARTPRPAGGGRRCGRFSRQHARELRHWRELCR